jgi:hypothetical protein
MMKADREFGGGDGEPEDLRKILRQWTVLGPPPEIEEQLRRTFRRRRSKKQRIVGLAVAAGLTLLLVHQVTGPLRPGPPGVAERAASVAPPASTPPSPVMVPPTRIESRAPLPSVPARARRAPTAPPAETEVVVEPGQAELLVQLARQLRGTRQALPGVSVPRIDEVRADAPASPIPEMQVGDDVLAYRSRWEKVGSEWPTWHRSL